jgi:hypothetical protein
MVCSFLSAGRRFRAVIFLIMRRRRGYGARERHNGEFADSTGFGLSIYSFVAGIAVVKEGEKEKAHKIGMEMAGWLGGGKVDW